MGDLAVAYIVKGYPRLSETFVASEIHRVEQAGVRVRLFALLRPDDEIVPDVVARIAAQPTYAPATTSLSATGWPRWLWRNIGPFRRPLALMVRRRPAGALRAAIAITRQWARAPRAAYVKEWLQATVIASDVLDDGEITHIHAHFAHSATTVAWIVSMMTGIPFSFTGHAKDIYAPDLNPAGLLRTKIRAARFVVTCTEANRKFLSELAPGADIRRIYHGLTVEHSAGSPSEPARAMSPLRVLGAGRLVEKKGFDTLVDAAAIVVAAGVDVEVVLAGEEGSAGAQIRERVHVHGLDDHVRFLGPMAPSALMREYAAASVFCLPCRVLDNGDRDGIPNVLVEAMAAGVPVVTTPVSGIPELVEDGVNGLLVAPDDSTALARALMTVQHDSALRARLVERARADVRERFDGDRLAAELVAAFRVGS